MSFITRTGNLAATPELRRNENGQPYCFATVIVNDTINNNGTYETISTTPYNLTVNGTQAEQLVATAEQSGNIRVTFTGTYRIRNYKRDDGSTGTSHDVRVTDIGASFKGQQVSVTRLKQEGQAGGRIGSNKVFGFPDAVSPKLWPGPEQPV